MEKIRILLEVTLECEKTVSVGDIADTLESVKTDVVNVIGHPQIQKYISLKQIELKRVK